MCIRSGPCVGVGVYIGAGVYIVKSAPSPTSAQPPNVCIGSLVVVLDLVAGAKATASIQNHRPFFTHSVGLKIFLKSNL